MEKSDYLKPDNEVVVSILGPDNECLYKATSKGYHTLEQAVYKAIEQANIKVSPEDCVFEITNQESNVSHKYRLNAHGHLKLIV